MHLNRGPEISQLRDDPGIVQVATGPLVERSGDNHVEGAGWGGHTLAS